MLILHSFLQSVYLFVKSLAVKVTKEMYRSSSVLMAGMMVVAIIAFSANGFGGSGKNALAAPMTEDSGEEPGQEEGEDGGLAAQYAKDESAALLTAAGYAEDGYAAGFPVTDEKIQFGLLDTDSHGQHLAGALLTEHVRKQQRRQAAAKTEIEALQKQILKEKQEQEAKRKAEEERKAARKIRLSDEDYQILLRIVQAEAGICDAKGKILVADVIINRVISQKFPDSVKSVVYQKSQFQPVSNGAINSVKVSAETIACVDRALDGEDYSGGALYFMNRRGSGSHASWFDSNLTYLFAHDGHEFFR